MITATYSWNPNLKPHRDDKERAASFNNRMRERGFQTQIKTRFEQNSQCSTHSEIICVIFWISDKAAALQTKPHEQ